MDLLIIFSVVFGIVGCYYFFKFIMFPIWRKVYGETAWGLPTEYWFPHYWIEQRLFKKEKPIKIHKQKDKSLLFD